MQLKSKANGGKRLVVSGIGGASPIPAFTLERAPSAELRPGQTDQESLPPYDRLDPILRLLIEEDRSVADVAALGYGEADVERVLRLIRAAEWKRYQMPPGVKISPRAFGRDWRWPITNHWKHCGCGAERGSGSGCANGRPGGAPVTPAAMRRPARGRRRAARPARRSGPGSGTRPWCPSRTA